MTPIPADFAAAEALIASSYADADPYYMDLHRPRLIRMAANAEAQKRREIEHRKAIAQGGDKRSRAA